MGVDCAADWRADEASDRGDSQAHAHISAYVLSIFGARSEADRDAGHDRSRAEAVEDSPDDNRSVAVRCLPAERQYTGADAGCEEHVHPAELVGKNCWNDTTGERGSVQDGDEVEGQSLAHSLRDGVHRKEEERSELPEKKQEGGHAEEGELRLQKGFRHEELVLAWRQSRLDDDGSEGEDCENDEGANPDRPPETQTAVLEHATERDREDDTANRGAGDGHAHSASALFVEVLRRSGHGRRHEEPAGDAGEDALGEQELPELFAEAGHEETQDVKRSGWTDDLRD